MDFDGTQLVSMDEVTILFLCTLRGVVVMLGTGTCPTDEDMEEISISIYREVSFELSEVF